MSETATNTTETGGQVHPIVMPDGTVETQRQRVRFENIKGIFNQPGFWRKLEFFFWRTLCCRPDLRIFGGYATASWWYNLTGNIAGYCHTMARPERYTLGWWAKYGHWCQVSFWRAMDHLFRGGKVRFGRW